MKKAAIFNGFLIMQLALLGQSNYLFYDQISVVDEQGDTLYMPFAGGLNNPEFSNIDFNGDGKNDLFIFDRFNNVIKCFVKEGDSQDFRYTFTKSFDNQFPAELEECVLLRDYNCDGFMDIFAKTIAGIQVFKNDGTNHFDLVSPLLLSKYDSGNIFNLFNSNQDIPAIDDIDGDGDLDILAYGNGENQMTYHKNNSMELYGTCDSLKFVATTYCWGEFAENALTNDIILGATCPFFAPDSSYFEERNNTRHAGSTMLTIDFDADGDKELITGDVSYRNAVFLNNGGDAIHAVMDTSFAHFPLDLFNFAPAVDILFPSGFYVDANNDSVKDLIFASNSTENANNTNSVWLYQNISNTDSMVLEFKMDNFLQDQMIDVGEKAIPVFFDYNNDGKQDIVVGTRGYFANTVYKSKLMLLENMGEIGAPAFKIIDRDYGGVLAQDLNGAYPTFGDLDNDTDMDMLVGDETGRLHYFENIAALGSNPVFQMNTLNYMDIDVGDIAVPQLFDFNNDGKLDLIIGERDGGVFYFENIGTPNQALFSSLETTPMLGGVDVKPGICCNGSSTPFMTYDANGNKILYVGSDRGKIFVYTDIVDYSTPFVQSSSIATMGFASVYGGSLFGQQNDVLLVGEALGGFHILKREDVLTGFASKHAIKNELQILPNPASNRIQITSATSLLNAQLSIFDVQGRKLQTQKLSEGYKHEVWIESLRGGIYHLVIETQDNIISTKFVKVEP